MRRMIANSLTIYRMICGVGILFTSLFNPGFYILYISGGIADMFDGFFARKLGTESEFGAKLDTIADAVFAICVLIKLITSLYVPIWLIVWVVVIAIVKLNNIVKGRISHSVLNKLTGLVVFATPLAIVTTYSNKTLLLCIVLISCTLASIAAVVEKKL